MLDSYIKKLENIIVPRRYNLSEVKQINTNFDSREFKNRTSISQRETSVSDDFAKSRKTYTDLTMQPIKEESSRVQTIADEEKLSLIEIINIEKKKNMNYRFENTELTRKIEYLNQKIVKQNETITKLERQKDLDSKYLIKLEATMINKPATNTTRQFNNVSKIELDGSFKSSFNKLLFDENQKLKRFQEEVFKISRNYDEVNDELIYHLKEIQSLLSLTNEDYRNEKILTDTIDSIKRKHMLI
jgi:hypothetical protein